MMNRLTLAEGALDRKQEAKRKVRLPAFAAPKIKRKEGTLFKLAVVGFLLGRASILNTMFPFGMAYLAALTVENKALALPLAVVTGLGSFTVQPRLLSAGLFGGILLFAAINAWLFRTKTLSGVFTALLAAFCLLAGRMPFLGRQSSPLYQVLLYSFEAGLCVVVTFIFLYGISLFSSRPEDKSFTNEEVIAAVIIITTALSGVGMYEIGEIKVASVLAKMFVLTVAFAGGGAVGAAAGTAAGVVLSITKPVSPALLGMLSFSGMLSGAFQELGRLGAGLGAVLGTAVLALFLGDPAALPRQLTETGIAFGLFLLIPREWLKNLAVLIPGTAEQGAVREKREKKLLAKAADRLQDISRIFAEVGDIFRSGVNDGQQADNERPGLIRAVADRVCSTCRQYFSCWENSSAGACRIVDALWDAVEKRGGCTADDFPPMLKRHCLSPDCLVQTINHLSELKKLHDTYERALNESRNLVAEQLKGFAEVVEKMAAAVNAESSVPAQTDRAAKQLRSLGIPVRRIECHAGRNGPSLIVHKEPCRGEKECAFVVAPVMGKAMGRTMSVEPARCGLKAGHGCEVRLIPSPSYSLVTGFAQMAKDGAPLSGDSFACRDLPDGRSLVIISDGMGVGPEAASESSTAVHLLEKLFAAGFDEKLVIRTVNTVLALRSVNESFATVDLVLFDRGNGDVKFFKIGAAASFIKRGGKVETIHASTLPIGILAEVTAEPIVRHLQPGDLLVMASDGVVECRRGIGEGDEWLERYLTFSKTRDPQTVADEILAAAVSQSKGKVNDDLTVVAFRVEEM